jgi:hypothetical protein
MGSVPPRVADSRVACVAIGLALAACHGAAPSLTVGAGREIGLVPQSAAISGHDGGASAILFGRSVWMYGDTALTVKDVDGVQWHSNSFAWTDAVPGGAALGDFHERLDAAGAPAPLVPNTDEEAAFIRDHAGDPCRVMPCGARWAIWPGASVWDAARGRGLVFYGLVYAEPGAFNFHGVGQSLAVWSAFDGAPARPIVRPGTVHPTLLFGEDEPGFGSAAAVDGDDLYALACDSSGFARPCKLARVSLADALDRAAWTYWNGEAFVPSLGDARAIFDGGLGVSLFRLGTRWVAVYAHGLSNDVVLRTAPALTGPWSDEARLFTADRRGDDGWTYDAYVHPELTPATLDALFVTFTRPNGQGWFGSETPLVRVDVAAP